MNNLCASDFYKPTTFNCDTQNQIWMSTIADGHDNFCSCTGPFAHLLASIFPPGHQDRNKTIEEILQRDYQEQCHSGGKGAGGHGSAAGATAAAASPEIKEENQEEDMPGDEIEELLAAAENTR